MFMERPAIDLYEQLCERVKLYHKECNFELLKRAFFFASHAHEGHERKNGDPYIIHPLHAALHLTRIQADDITLAGAILHDVLDNPWISIEMVRQEFWEEIAKLVEGVTRLGNIYYRVEMTSEEVEKLKKSLVSAGEDIRIFLIKIAERLHNLETLHYLPQEKRYRIAKESEEIYIPILNFLAIWEFMSEFNELCFQYIDEKQYKKLTKIFGKNKQTYEKIIIRAYEQVKQELDKSGMEYTISSRIKSLHSIYKKVIGKQIEPENVYDFLALRILCSNGDDCYKTLGKIHKLFQIKEDKFKDYISLPKENGYQSLHTTVYDRDGNMLEFQIQTYDMYELNKTGLAAHFIYKGFWIDFENFPEWMRGILDLQKHTLDSNSFLQRLRNEVLITEIKCYDEEGQRYILPKESFLLDFAFEKSESHGAYFFSALVNEVSITDPFFRISNGDKIELTLWETPQISYKAEQLILIKNPKTLQWLIKYGKKYNKNMLIAWGKLFLNTTLDQYWGKDFWVLPDTIQKAVIKKMGVYDHDQLYLLIITKNHEVENIVKLIKSFSDEKYFSHEVSFKIFTKLWDTTILQTTTKILYHLGISMKKISYNQKKWVMYLDLYVGKREQYDELLKELKRAPNVAEVIRIFPLKLVLYCALLTFLLTLILGVIFWSWSFEIVYYDVFLFSGWLLFLLMMMRQLTKYVFHYFYRLKRGLYFLFFTNSVAFLAVFSEFIELKFYTPSLVGFSFLTFMVFILLFYNIFSTYSLYYKNK